MIFIVKTGCFILAASITIYVASYLREKSSVKKLIKKKRVELAKKKQEAFLKMERRNVSLDDMDKITNLKLKDLRNGIKSGLFTPEKVSQAYLAKALIMDKEYNFITDINPRIDENLISIQNIADGPLKGIPVSIKECYYVEGCDSTCGMLDQAFSSSEKNHPIVTFLRSLGMVPFVVTNNNDIEKLSKTYPSDTQAALSIHTSNPIFGDTLNPVNKSKTCGGSSGGEGAILGSGASILGIGGDVGGSIRIPASFCGIYGFKPTNNRFYFKKYEKNFSKQNIINETVGPFARHIDDLIIFYKTMVCSNIQKLSPYCPPVGFNNNLYENKKPLKIGYYIDLEGSLVTSVPAVVRAVDIAKEALKTAGHSIIEITIPDIHNAMFNLYIQCMFADGGTGYLKHYIKNNPIDSCIESIVTMLNIPNPLKKMISYLTRPFNKSYSIMLSNMMGTRSVYNLFELNDKINNYREMVYNKWIEHNLDGLICPVLPVVALPLKASPYLTNIINYTAIYNLLDYPAGSVPVTKVNNNDIEKLSKTYPSDTHIQKKVVENQKDTIGMPVGVQCVSMVWQEEICLRIMKDISEFTK